MIFALHGQTTFHSNLVSDIRIAKEAGFEALEIITEKLLRYLNVGLQTEDLVQVFQQHAIRPACIDILGDIERIEPNEHKQLLEEAERLCTVANILNCPTIQINPFCGLVGRPWEEIRNLTAKNIAEIADIGKQYGVQAINVPNSVLLAAPHNQSYYFDFNKSLVKNKYLASIQAQANYLMQHPKAKILVAGNTDARGSHEYNMALGERRALAVVRVLEEDGVNSSQIKYLSYGDMRPIALGHSAAAYAKNRRVDLTYKSY